MKVYILEKQYQTLDNELNIEWHDGDEWQELDIFCNAEQAKKHAHQLATDYETWINDNQPIDLYLYCFELENNTMANLVIKWDNLPTNIMVFYEDLHDYFRETHIKKDKDAFFDSLKSGLYLCYDFMPNVEPQQCLFMYHCSTIEQLNEYMQEIVANFEERYQTIHIFKKD